MSRLRIASIVEGDGEVSALPELLRRVWTELLNGEYIDVLRPIRCKRDKLIRSHFNELPRMVELASKLLNAKRDATPELILVLIDAEDEFACQLGPILLKRGKECRPDFDVSCVIANHCYETWFAAASDSLIAHLDLTGDSQLPTDPEQADLRKSWVSKRIRRAKYSETVDQVRLTAAMDLSQCRANSRSFDKLCRELEDRLHSKPAG